MVTPGNTARLWFALHVRARHEKVVAGTLEGKGLEDFLPVHRVRRNWSDRSKELEAPLFPGYVFCRYAPEQKLKVLTTPGVVSIVGAGKCPFPVPDHEIEALKAVVRSGLPAQPWPYLEVGQMVRIDAGPLAGLEGILLELKSKRRLIVSVALLQRSVAVEVEEPWVTPLPVSRRPPAKVA